MVNSPVRQEVLCGLARFSRCPNYSQGRPGYATPVPSDWRTIPLKYVAQLVYGDTLPGGIREDGDVPVFGSNGRVGTHSTSNTLGPAIIVRRKGSFGKINYSEQPCFAIDTTFF